LDNRKDILIFGADHVSIPTQNPRHISIQHGISWDLPVKYMTHREIVKYEWAAKLKNGGRYRPANEILRIVQIQSAWTIIF